MQNQSTLYLYFKKIYISHKYNTLKISQFISINLSINFVSIDKNLSLLLG